MKEQSRILLDLAETLDPAAVIKKHGIGKDELRGLLQRAAALLASREEDFGDASFVVATDGAARGNPGPAGAGFVIYREGRMVEGQAQYLGRATNNQAEYHALILGLERAVALGVARVEALSDSELMVKQMNGEYRVKNRDLKELYSRAGDLASKFESFKIRHVPREKNQQADLLANRAIDEFADQHEDR